MANGWDGADPVQFNEPGVQLELGTKYTANDDIILSAVRVWHGASSGSVSGRNGKIWSAGGTVLREATMDSSLVPGWTNYSLTSPLSISNGTVFIVSYDTVSFYGAVTAAPLPNDSADLKVTANEGRLNTTPDLFPATVAGTTFYGIDVVYTEDTSGNQPPVITGMLVTTADLQASASVNITDEASSGVTVLWEWGDGTTTLTGAGVTAAVHTYTAGGLYAVMATATDSAGLQDSEAYAIQLLAPIGADSSESWIDPIFDAVISDVQASGYFRKVNKHEPKRPPAQGLTAAVWVDAMRPVGQLSGLVASSALLVFNVRIYSNMMEKPEDDIDPRMLKAAANIMRRYHDDFDFGGLIRNVDLLGITGTQLTCVAGYLEIAQKMYRIYDITVPCIVNDVWVQG